MSHLKVPEGQAWVIISVPHEQEKRIKRDCVGQGIHRLRYAPVFVEMTRGRYSYWPTDDHGDPITDGSEKKDGWKDAWENKIETCLKQLFEMHMKNKQTHDYIDDVGLPPPARWPLVRTQ